MSIAVLVSFLLIFLVGTAFLTALNSSFRRIHKEDPRIKSIGKRFFYRPFHLFFFPEQEYEGIFFATISALNITRFGYATCAVLILLQIDWIWQIPMTLLFLLIAFVFGDYVPRLIGTRFSDLSLKNCTFVSSFFMLIAFPITYLCLKISTSLFQSVYLDRLHEPSSQAKQEIIDIIEKTHLTPDLTTHEKKLIESVLRFKDRIAREIMVPRVDVFGLAAETPIREAAKLIEEEGYSRIPIYRNTVDEIIGVVMYKDIINQYMEYEANGNDPKILDAPIESIQKGVLYTPEMKKISNLLLDFRKKQVHLAIVVDEYGGTEGIVTIEDILEEIVGEIADEYDVEEELYYGNADGSWVIDARMGILDVEEQLGIKIPQEGDYDTIGGYVFHCAGAIPTKGFEIHHEDFAMEILRSNDRCVEKVRLKPIIETKEEE